MNSLYANMEEQTLISHTWLSRMENSGISIYILDNGKPYLHNKLTKKDGENEVYEQALSLYRTTWPQEENLSGRKGFHREFVFNSARPSAQASHMSAGDYYVSGASLVRENSLLTVLTLYSLDSLHRQALRQRLLVVFLNLAGVLVLYLFSRFFTGKLLAPIRENQEQQLRFLAASSHELRTPLAVILASVSACELAPYEKQKAFFANIREEGQRMQQLLGDLLLLCTQDPARETNEKQPASPDTLTLNAYEHFLPLMQQKGISFEILLPEEEIPLLTCNEEKILQALNILLQNALSYTESGGHISLKLTVTPRFVTFAVSDTGCGIPDRDKEKIFERFYRADTSRCDKNHFGLGLSIATGIAASHDGRISVTDNLPKGSVFTLALPRK